jgi:predicted RND superfamily exporter protein
LHKLDAGLEREEAIAVASQELALPCFLTSLTTALGFAAFATSSAPTIRYYGIAVAIGVALSWVTTVVLLPVLLAVAPVPKRQFRAGYATAAIDALLARVWPFARRQVRLVYGLLALILLSGALCARSQRVVNEYVGGLPRGEERDQVRELERSLTGIVRFAVYLEGPPESMRQPAVLQAMERIELAALRIPLITYSASLASAVAEINGAFQGGGAESRSVPRSRALIAQYLALLSPEDRLRLASDDYSRSQIVILARDEGSLGAAALARSLQAALDASGLHELGVRVTLTGAGIAAYRGLDRVVSEVIYGFLIALLLVAALVAALFRSVRIALISVIPNLVPIALCFLTLRAFSINLRMDNSLVLGICIGGLFNTTIHLGARVRQLAQDPALSPDAVVEQSLRTVGPAAIFTSVILSAGFLVLTLSRFPGLQVLGLLSMVTLLSAMVADIVLSPLLFRALYGWKSAGRAARDPSVVEGGV